MLDTKVGRYNAVSEYVFALAKPLGKLGSPG